MASQLGPIEFDCDAPPYVIVKACHMVDIQSPEDVGWRRLGRYLRAPSSGGGLSLHDPGRAARRQCVCGRALPDLVRCTFTLLSGREETYFLGQCARCHTVYWEEV